MILPFLFIFSQFQNTVQASSWVVVFDCGSTKTAVYAYMFINNNLNQMKSEKWKRGLGEFDPSVTANRNLIKENVARILSRTTSLIPRHSFPVVPVFVYATAGLRALSRVSENVEELKGVFNSV